MFILLRHIHPAVRLVIAAAVAAAGVAVHRDAIVALGGVAAAVAAVQWLLRARGFPGSGGSRGPRR